jgi:hypothetical protein
MLRCILENTKVQSTGSFFPRKSEYNGEVGFTFSVNIELQAAKT